MAYKSRNSMEIHAGFLTLDDVLIESKGFAVREISQAEMHKDMTARALIIQLPKSQSVYFVGTKGQLLAMQIELAEPKSLRPSPHRKSLVRLVRDRSIYRTLFGIGVLALLAGVIFKTTQSSDLVLIGMALTFCTMGHPLGRDVWLATYFDYDEWRR